MGAQNVYVMKDKYKSRDELYDDDTEMGIGRSASSRRHTSKYASEKVSNEEYIKELQAEIDRLKADSAKGDMMKRHEDHRD